MVQRYEVEFSHGEVSDGRTMLYANIFAEGDENKGVNLFHELVLDELEMSARIVPYMDHMCVADMGDVQIDHALALKLMVEAGPLVLARESGTIEIE
jgi:hypothetical protein